MTKLERLAGEVAIAVPTDRNKYAQCANVPWPIIEALRAELDRRKFDWRTYRLTYIRLKAERIASAVRAKFK